MQNSRQSPIKALSDKQISQIDVEKIGLDSPFMELGAIAYTIGVGFFSTPGFTVEATNARERLAKAGFSKTSIKAFIDRVYSLRSNEQYRDAIQEEYRVLATQVDSEITLSTADYKKLNKLFRTITNQSFIPVSMAIEVKNIIDNTNISYGDVLKMNTLLSIHYKLIGGQNAITTYGQIYSFPPFIQTMERAIELVDQQRLADAYIDAFFTAAERAPLYPLEDLFINDLDVEFSTADNAINLDLAEEANDTGGESTDEEVATTKSEAPSEKLAFHLSMPRDEFQELLDTDPNNALRLLMWDAAGFAFNNIATLIEVIDELAVSEGGKNLYKFMGSYMSKIKPTYDRTFTPQIAIDKLHAKITEMQAEYKRKAEILMAPIPENKIKTVAAMCNTCISALVLSQEVQKTYLISQLYENGIKTYNQLQQIVNLIEQSDICGEYVDTYVRLYNYMQESVGDFESIMKESSDMPQLEQTIAFFIQFRNWFAQVAIIGCYANDEDEDIDIDEDNAEIDTEE